MRACDVESINDFRRYYTGWLGVGENPTIPLKLRGVDDPRLHFVHLSDTKDGIVYGTDTYKLKWDECLRSFTFGSPYVGMVVNKGVLWYGSVLAERQWQRGFNPERVKWFNFNSWSLRNCPETFPTNASYDVIWHVFNPRYDTIASAQFKLDAGQQVGAALSRHYGMFTLPDREYPGLAYKRWIIGYVKPDRSIVLGTKYRDYEGDLKTRFNTYVKVE